MAPANGPSSARTIAMRSTGATALARLTTSSRSGPSSSSPARDAAADDHALGREHDDDVRDRDPQCAPRVPRARTDAG